MGYGDVYPVTTEGRVVACLLMAFGIGLISFVIGTATSWVVETVTAADELVLRTDREVDELTAEVLALRAELAALSQTWSGTGTDRTHDSDEGPPPTG